MRRFIGIRRGRRRGRVGMRRSRDGLGWRALISCIVNRCIKSGVSQENRIGMDGVLVTGWAPLSLLGSA